MATASISFDNAARLRAVFSTMIGFFWLLAIMSITEPVSIWLDARYHDEFKLGVDGELLLFAASALPLAFVHAPSAGLSRVWIAHSGAFTLLSTFSLLLSPAGPFSLSPWAPYDSGAEPKFLGPLAVWGVMSVAALGVERLGLRIKHARMDPAVFEVMSWGGLAILIAAHWWLTLRFIMGGFPLMSRSDDLQAGGVRGLVMAGYIVVSIIGAGAFRRPPRARPQASSVLH